MTFRNPYDRFTDRHYRYQCVSGDRYHPDYVGHYDENGRICLECCGKTDMYSEIQSHSDSCNIQTILRRFDGGEVDVLSRVQGVYADVLEMPKSYAEMLQLVRNAELEFNSLPLEVRQLFGCDFGSYMSSYGTDDFFRRLKSLDKSSSDPADPVATSVDSDLGGDNDAE